MAVFSVATAAGTSAQDTRSTGASHRNELTVSVTAAAGGARYLHSIGRVFEFGVAVSAGPVYGVVISDDGVRDLREWASAYPMLAVRPGPGFRAFLAPIGVAGALGNDFGQVYPSAQAGVEIEAGRFRIASTLGVVRVAGGHGTGQYWVQWIPVRVGYAFRW